MPNFYKSFSLNVQMVYVLSIKIHIGSRAQRDDTQNGVEREMVPYMSQFTYWNIGRVEKKEHILPISSFST